MQTNKKKIISIISIVAILVIAMAIFVVAVVMDSKENEGKKQAQIPALVSDDKMDVYTDSEGNQAPIPKGYVASKATGETEIKTGLVIYEGTDEVNDSNVSTAQTTRNQYVWVPVPNPSEMYGTDANGKKWGKLYDFSSTGVSNNNWTETDGVMRINSSTSYREPDIVKDYDKDSKLKTYGLGIKTTYEFQIQLEKEFNEMIASVEKHGGFYIGRYENNYNGANPRIVKNNNTNIAFPNWYNMYKKSKEIAGEKSNVKTSIIWGCQWDRTLQWLVESGNKTYAEITNSTSWGNYGSSIGEAITGSGVIRPTGYNEAWKANNIYDMAGNMIDWTMEAYGNGIRIYRRRKLGKFSL